MLNRLIIIVYCIVSVILYTITPLRYSSDFCRSQMIIYLLFGLYLNYIMIKRTNLINFFLFFSISFFFITFFHAAFYVRNDSIIHAFLLGYNTNNINQSISIAQLCNSFMSLALFWNLNQQTYKYTFYVTRPTINQYFRISFWCVILYDIYVLLILNREYAYTLFYPKLSLAVLSIVVFCGIITFFNVNSKQFLKKPYIVKYTILVLLFILPYLLLNSRTNMIGILLFVLFSVNIKIYHIKLLQLLFIIPVALLFMCIIMVTRISSVNFSNSSFIDVVTYGIDNIFQVGDFNQIILFVTTDLVANAKNLYDSISYTNNHELLYGITYLPFLFSWFPGLSTIILRQLDLSVDNVNTSKIFTNFNSADWGLGTHIIGDLYINGLLFAVCIGMFILGYIIRISINKNSLIGLLLYISLLCNALILPRACAFSFLEMFYIFLWQYFILYFFKKIKL